MKTKKLRFKNADARIIKYQVICPYAKCGITMVIDELHKGELITCHNCRKEFKIRRIV